MITQLQLPAGAKIMPDFMLSVEDKALERNVSERVMSLKMTDNSGFAADMLNITFDDSDGAFQMPERGTVLSLSLGWAGQNLIGCGRFVVDTVIHKGAPDTLDVTARSADLRESMNTQGSYSYDDTTLGAIVNLISRRNKLPPANLLPEMAAIKIAHIDQTGETDAFFLMRLAQMYGAQATVKYGQIILIKPGYGITGSGKAIPWMTIERSDGDTHSFKLSDVLAYSGVKAKWHDVKKGQSNKVGVQRTKKANSSAKVSHPNAKTPASPSAAGSAKEESYISGSNEKVLELNKIYPDEESATRAADAIFKQIQYDAATFDITLALGRADLFAQTPVTVSGFKDVIDQQRWIIDSVVHDVAGQGFVTTLKLKVYVEDITYQATSI